MDSYWSWGGKYVGVRQREYLTAPDGRILGRFWGMEIYGRDGGYLGELGRNDRLIRDKKKEKHRRPAFSAGVAGAVTQPRRDIAPYPLMTGYEDFLPKT